MDKDNKCKCWIIAGYGIEGICLHCYREATELLTKQLEQNKGNFKEDN